MPVPLPHTFATKTILSGTELDENFTALANKFNGGIVASDVSATAGFTTASMSASYQKMVVNLSVSSVEITAAGWPAAGSLAFCPIPGLNTETDWVPVSYSWVCTDTGNAPGTAQFAVDWGYFNNAAWVTSSIVIPPAAATILVNPAAGANLPNSGTGNCSNGTPFGVQQRSLRLYSAAASATTLQATLLDCFSISIILTRQIQAT